MARRLTLRSPLPPLVLATKLRDVLGDKDDKPEAGVTGRGSDVDMTLFVYRPNVENSFATNLTATMTADGGGTLIAGRIGTPASAIVFLWLWFGFLSTFLIGAAVAAAVGAPFIFWGMFGGIPLAMMALGLGMWRIGTWTAGKDEAAILHFLAETVQAREP